MSKSSKLRSKETNKRNKATKKAQEQAKYNAFRDAGTNSKSKRSVLNAKRKRNSPQKHQHLIADCGNPGCKRCYPRAKVIHAIHPK